MQQQGTPVGGQPSSARQRVLQSAPPPKSSLQSSSRLSLGPSYSSSSSAASATASDTAPLLGAPPPQQSSLSSSSAAALYADASSGATRGELGAMSIGLSVGGPPLSDVTGGEEATVRQEAGGKGSAAGRKKKGKNKGGKKIRQPKVKRMSPEEELDLSPWAKWRLYRKFPFKLLIHILLTIMTTVIAILINRVFDGYSRSIGSTWAPLLFPDGYQSSESNNWGKGYELYDVNTTLYHAQYLVNAYLTLPSTSVDSVVIWDDPYLANSTDLEYFRVPTLSITRSSSETGSVLVSTTTTYALHNSTSGWPLAKDSALAEAYATNDVYVLEDFFNDLESMKFEFIVQTDGVTDMTVSSCNLCVYWKIVVLYDLGARGQFTVRLTDKPLGRCDDLPLVGPLQKLSLAVLLLSGAYLFLLCKATHHHFLLLKKIYKTRTLMLELASKNAAENIAAPAVRSGGLGSISSGGAPSEQQQPQPSEALYYPTVGSGSVGGGADTLVSRNSYFSARATTAGDGRPSPAIRRGIDEAAPSLSLSAPSGSQLSDLRTPLLPPPSTTGSSFSTAGSFPSSYPSVSSSSRGGAKSGPLSNKTAAQRDLFARHAAAADRAWNALSWRDKYLYIFNLWFIVATFACVCTITYGARVVASSEDLFTDQTLRVVLGAGVMTFWVSLAQYLEYFPRFYLLIWTLKTGLPRVAQFFVGILPFFVGYALLGMVLFGDEVDLFGTLSSTCCTLFAVVNGDSVYDVFVSLWYIWPLGDIYLYLYVMLFMYVVLMSVIAIVEEAFFDSLRCQGISQRLIIEEQERASNVSRPVGGAVRRDSRPSGLRVSATADTWLAKYSSPPHEPHQRRTEGGGRGRGDSKGAVGTAGVDDDYLANNIDGVDCRDNVQAVGLSSSLPSDGGRIMSGRVVKERPKGSFLPVIEKPEKSSVFKDLDNGRESLLRGGVDAGFLSSSISNESSGLVKGGRLADRPVSTGNAGKHSPPRTVQGSSSTSATAASTDSASSTTTSGLQGYSANSRLLPPKLREVLRTVSMQPGMGGDDSFDHDDSGRQTSMEFEGEDSGSGSEDEDRGASAAGGGGGGSNSVYGEGMPH